MPSLFTGLPLPSRTISRPDAVRRADVAAVRHGVAALNQLPRLVLRLPVLLLLRRMPADGGRIEQDLRALQRREARALGKPLVPADQHADRALRGVPRAEPRVTRREVELLVEERVVGDVHLAIDAHDRAVGFDDDGGVVIEAGRALLEHRGDDHRAVLARQRRQRLGGRAREWSRRGRRTGGLPPGRSTAIGTVPACRRCWRRPSSRVRPVGPDGPDWPPDRRRTTSA